MNNESLTVKMPEQPVPSRKSIRNDAILTVVDLVITTCWVIFLDGGAADRFLIALFAFLSGIQVMGLLNRVLLRQTALRVLAKAKAEAAREAEENDRF